MPKLTDKFTKYKDQTNEIIDKLEMGIFRSKRKQAYFTKKLGICRTTLHNHLKNPDMMPLGELRALCNEIGVEIILKGKWENDVHGVTDGTETG